MLPYPPSRPIDAIRAASRQLVRELGFMGAGLAGTDLSPSAVHALIEIEADRLTARDLAGLLRLEKSSVSRMLRKLVLSGDIVEEAGEGDGRRKALSLTGTGKTRVAAIHAFARAQVSEALDRLKPGQEGAVLEGLRLYADALAGGNGASAAAPSAEATRPPSLSELAGEAPVRVPSARLQGRVCLVIGATSGIGRATALRMGAEGAAAVVVTGRREERGRALAEEIQRLGAESLFVAADVTREADVARTIERTMARFGRLDAAFNNAGFQERRAPLAEQTDDVYAEVFDTNVRAVFHAMRHEIPALLASGGGAIVNNASVSGIRNPNPGLALYGASKAAAISLTRAAAMEYASAGIRVNAVAPGRVVTDMMLRSGVGDMRAVAAGLPLKRMGHPEDVAAAVVWLMCDESAYVVGHVLAADGGFLAG